MLSARNEHGGRFFSWKTASVCKHVLRWRSVADERHEGHETRSLDRVGNGVLAGC